MTRLLAFAVASVLATGAAGQAPKGPPASPKSLLIYYSYPSAINGSRGDAAAAQKHFAQYDFVVLGAGLEDPKHPDHAKTAAIIKGAKHTAFFGYVDLGVSTTNLPLKDVAAKLEAWGKMGVRGILLDDFGFDYKVDRERQNAAVEAAHKLKLRVIANAWKPEDAFGDADGKAPALTKDDIYLWESYRFQEGAAVPVDDWRKKAETIATLQKKIPFEVFSASTTKQKTTKLQESFAHQWYCAALDGYAATGWGQPSFASADGDAPHAAPPAGKTNLGVLAGEVERKDATLTRPTSTGILVIDAEKLTGKFVAKRK
jgi:hypothetical protein